MDYFAHIGILIGVYAVLAVTLDLQAGYAGQFSLAHAAIWGLGAYTYGVIASFSGAPWILCVAISLAAGTLIGAAAALPATRLAPDQFVIATFAAQAVFIDVVRNWTTVTGGPSGLAGIPNAMSLGGPPPAVAFFTVVALVLATITFLICTRTVRSPLGRILRAMREDPTAAEAAGKNTALVKATIFATTSALCACAGAVYASYMTFIDPSSFGFSESVFILTLVIAGGASTLFGPVAAAAFLILFQEVLRLIGLPASLLGNIRGITVGFLLVLIVVLRPEGILGGSRNSGSREAQR